MFNRRNYKINMKKLSLSGLMSVVTTTQVVNSLTLDHPPCLNQNGELIDPIFNSEYQNIDRNERVVPVDGDIQGEYLIDEATGTSTIPVGVWNCSRPTTLQSVLTDEGYDMKMKYVSVINDYREKNYFYLIPELNMPKLTDNFIVQIYTQVVVKTPLNQTPGLYTCIDG